MKIESVSAIKNKPGKYVVRFDNESEIKVGAAQIADFGIFSGREYTDEAYVELFESLAINSAKARALKILGSRSLSAHEMERRLTSKGESVEISNKTVEWLVEIGAINDMEYACSIAKHYYTKGYGIARIREELYKRGISREFWDEAMEKLDKAGDSAYDFIKRKLKGSDDKEELRRVSKVLCARGFTYEEACAAIRKYVENIEEIRYSEQ